jgi:hypothetical protein
MSDVNYWFEEYRKETAELVAMLNTLSAQSMELGGGRGKLDFDAVEKKISRIR